MRGEYSLLTLPASALMLFRPTVAPARPWRVPREVRELMAPALEPAVVPATEPGGRAGEDKGERERERERERQVRTVEASTSCSVDHFWSKS